VAINVFPMDALSGAPNYTGRMARQTLGALTAGATAARPLGARSAVQAGTSVATVSATSTTWTVLPHRGVLDLEASAAAGPYFYSIDANVTGAVNPANATNPRIDLISVQLSDPAEGDGTAAPLVVPVYTPGIPAAIPVAPAAPARSITLATINVPASGGGSPTVTWLAAYTAASGGIIPCQSSGYYPASPYLGQYVDDSVLGLLRWNGSAWAQIVPLADAIRSFLLTPIGVASTPNTGTATWFSFGGVVVPPWATKAVAMPTVNSYDSSASALNVTIQLKIGAAGGISQRIQGSTVTTPSITSWSETIAGLTSGSQVVNMQATFVVGSGNFRVDTTTVQNLALIFLP
jgi:hypothetical protein